MKKRLAVFIFAGCLSLAACGSFGLSSPDAVGMSSRSAEAPIVEATRAYVKGNSNINRVRVDVYAVDGAYAVARVISLDEATDPAWVYLKHENGAWVGLTIGTYFPPELYQQLEIPPSLWAEALAVG